MHISVLINIKQRVLSWDTYKIHRVLLAGMSLHQDFRGDYVDQAFFFDQIAAENLFGPGNRDNGGLNQWTSVFLVCQI